MKTTLSAAVCAAICVMTAAGAVREALAAIARGRTGFPDVELLGERF